MIRGVITTLLVILILQSRQQTTHPYVPPLTHVPELSMDLLGPPAAQPRFLLKELCRLHSCDQQLLNKHDQLQLKGRDLRLDMQGLSAELVGIEPKLDLSTVLQHRPLAEQDLGELKAWKPLPTTKHLPPTIAEPSEAASP